MASEWTAARAIYMGRYSFTRVCGETTVYVLASDADACVAHDAEAVALLRRLVFEDDDPTDVDIDALREPHRSAARFLAAYDSEPAP